MYLHVYNIHMGTGQSDYIVSYIYILSDHRKQQTHLLSHSGAWEFRNTTESM